MSEKSNLISKLKTSQQTRLAYIKGKLSVLIPSQIRALRLKSGMPRQADLAKAVEMQQSRISMFETPGAANFTIDTLARLAAVFRVGLIVKFVPFHKMLQEENSFSQDSFDVVRLEKDTEFLSPPETKPEVVSGFATVAVNEVIHQGYLGGLSFEQGVVKNILGIGWKSATERNLEKPHFWSVPHTQSATATYQQASHGLCQ